MKTGKILLLVLLFAFCLWLPAIGLAAENTYRITETELNILQGNLNQLQILNGKSQKELSLLKIELQESKSELAVVKKESETLRNELMALKEISMAQESLLQSANESLKTYATAEKEKRRLIKRQRNLAYGLSAVLLYTLIRQ